MPPRALGGSARGDVGFAWLKNFTHVLHGLWLGRKSLIVKCLSSVISLWMCEFIVLIC